MTVQTRGAEAKRPSAQFVQDDRGQRHELGRKIAEGGQGVVLTVRGNDRLLVKVSKLKDADPKGQSWREQIRRVHRLPIVENGLPIAMPKALIVKPRSGYLMELMDGLIPLETLLIDAQAAFLEGEGLSGYLVSGGLGRRLRLLSRLARVLARLHGLAIAHGDLSPKNVFVSASHEHDQVWLIDCDNLTYAVRDSHLQVYTPDYGAPELVREDSSQGISTFTDVWSFAVMAFQLLTVLHPFKSGDLVDSDSELESAALRGELPWVDHPEDDSNRASLGVPRELVCTPALRELFDRCFRLGVNDSGERPVMAEWAEAFEAAVAVQVLCDAAHDGCGSTFLWNRRTVCPFCDAEHPTGSVLRLVHYVFASLADLGEDAKSTDRAIQTGYHQTVASTAVVLRSSPPGSACHVNGAPVVALQIQGDELVLHVEPNVEVQLKTGASRLVLLRGKVKLPRLNVRRELYIGKTDRPQDVWAFKW